MQFQVVLFVGFHAWIWGHRALTGPGPAAQFLENSPLTALCVGMGPGPGDEELGGRLGFALKQQVLERHQQVPVDPGDGTRQWPLLPREWAGVRRWSATADVMTQGLNAEPVPTQTCSDGQCPSSVWTELT